MEVGTSDARTTESQKACADWPEPTNYEDVSGLKCAPESVDVVSAKLLNRQIAVEVVRGGLADGLPQADVAQQPLTLVNEPVEAARDSDQMHAGCEWHGHLRRELWSDHARAYGEILDEAVAEFAAPGKVQTDAGLGHLIHVLAPPDGLGASFEAEPILGLHK
jgi:hypothetical protein